MESDKFQALRQALEGTVTNEEWQAEQDGEGFWNVVCSGESFDRYVIGNEGFYKNPEEDESNAKYVAAANPIVIKQLLDAYDDTKFSLKEMTRHRDLLLENAQERNKNWLDELVKARERGYEEGKRNALEHDYVSRDALCNMTVAQLVELLHNK